MASKIIVLGEINGNLESAFAKLSSLHTKNSFSLAIVVGNLFDDEGSGVDDLLSGKIHIPLSTYFTVGTRSLPQRVVDLVEKDEDICENLHYLGKRSTTKTSEGVKIVCLGGLHDDGKHGSSPDQHQPYHTSYDAKSLHGANSADVLITADWPAMVTKGSNVLVPEDSSAPNGSIDIANLCATLKPKYHFSSSPGFFYEREPFFYPQGDGQPATVVTRFISMAGYGNDLKQKSLYAFTLQSSANLAVTLPAGATITPFSQARGKKRGAEETNSYRFSIDGDRDHRRNKRGRRDRGPPPTPDTCFFCLANVNLATHLVASIGEDAYLATAKGPLTTSSTFAESGVKFPCHVLIIPLSHSPTLASIAEESRQATLLEMTRYRKALQSMVADRSNNMLGAVTYEISRGSGIHTHWQFLPVPQTLISKGLVEAAFRVEAENFDYPQFAVKDPGIGIGDEGFFRVWVWSPPTEDTHDGSTKCLTLPLTSDMRFDLQFGRRVLAKLLGLEKRLQWRDCNQTDEEETVDVEAFKKSFKDFDFSL